MSEQDELLAIARHAVALGADLLHSGRPARITEKADRDIVTDIDMTIERAVRSYLASVTPSMGFLGEEHGTSGPDAEYVWVLDPIDGTANFAHGIPLCAIQLALTRQNVPVVAAVVAPFLGLRYHASAGQGAFCNDEPIRVRETTELSRSIVSLGDFATGDDGKQSNIRRLRLINNLADQAERVRMFGSAALDLASVAHGRTDAAIILSNKPWDIAPGALLVREAGGQVLDDKGSRHTSESPATVAVCSGLAPPIVSLLAACC